MGRYSEFVLPGRVVAHGDWPTVFQPPHYARQNNQQSNDAERFMNGIKRPDFEGGHIKSYGEQANYHKGDQPMQGASDGAELVLGVHNYYLIV